MTGTNSRLLRLGALVLTLALLGGACGGDDEDAGPTEDTGQQTGNGAGAEEVADGADTPAAQLRTNLDGLLAEHTFLAAAATAAATGGRDAELEAANAALEANTSALVAAMESVFGEEAGAFDDLWRGRVTSLVGYAQGGATRQDLLAGAASFASFVTAGLPDADVEPIGDRVTTQVTTLAGVVDAQRAGDHVKAWADLRTAAAQMSVVAEMLTAGMAAEFPNRISGDPTSAAADLVVDLAGGLREHVYLTAGATGAALDARTDEFMAAAAALDANSNALTQLVSGIYDAAAGDAFDSQWKRHIGFFVDYTTGLAGGDGAKQDQALEELLAYSKAFGAFVNSLSPELGADTVADLLRTHVVTLKAVLDAQAAGDVDAAYTSLRTAGEHMRVMASTLAAALVNQFPEKY